MSLKSLQNGDEVLRKGPWMPEEDEILVEYVRQFGARDWSSIRTKGLLPRTGKSCRLRWVNKLKPDLKRSGCKFSPEEEKLVVEMQAKLGNKWAKIASCLPGRTDNDVKNFWSTRQKRILRALQRPKMPSGSTDASADTSDLSKDPSLTNFGAFQVHNPCGAAPLIGSAMGPHFLFAEDGDNEFREAVATDIRHCHMHRHHVHTFNSLEADDILNSHKLLKPLSIGDMIPYTIEKDHLLNTMGKELVETKPTTYLHVQPLSVAFPCANMASRNTRSIKRRPRSRRDVRSSTILSCFEQPVVDSIDNCHMDGTATLLSEMNPNNFSYSNRPSHTTPIDSATSLQQNNNYLEFLLQSDGSLMQNNVQVFSPELNPLFLTNTHQWEKLPVLYSEDNSALYGGCNIKEVDSCSPDSVITNFTPDVFDSLEPLNSTPPEWWVVH
ncbi:hypothetical protein KC19_12G089500 [Ceratodon purpureus]|uniref:Uncharacterized protein n=1 Tax=Ceratodon purpureus TaxID=3225 RepID=A0A8T0G8Q0_CERPU|nr:hypothetical protein KC19_12G089500 [Ceratodon purpureus]